MNFCWQLSLDQTSHAIFHSSVKHPNSNEWTIIKLKAEDSAVVKKKQQKKTGSLNVIIH